jgi:hypothetical protein
MSIERRTPKPANVAAADQQRRKNTPKKRGPYPPPPTTQAGAQALAGVIEDAQHIRTTPALDDATTTDREPLDGAE